MTDLSQIKTIDLLNELASRPEVETFETGIYTKHEVTIKEKYSKDRTIRILDNAVVLVVKKS